MPRGDIALGGQEEYLPSHQFPQVNNDRWMVVRGEWILVFKPNAKEDRTEYPNVTENQTIFVPKGFAVQVMNGYARLTTSAEA